MYNWFE